MSNPDNALGTNGAYGGRTSVNAFNDVLATFTGRGVLSGWGCVPKTGLIVELGGDGEHRDVAIAEDNVGNKTTVNNISQAPVEVTMPAAPATNSRVDAIVAYIESSPSADGETDNYTAVNLLVVPGTAAATPTMPNDSDIRTAITADGASGSTAYYVVLATVTIPNGTTDIDATMITAGPSAGIGSSQIEDGSVSADKIDFTTMPGNYSTSEIDTGYTWIDGKHIYKKTVSLGECPNQAEKRVPSGITNFDKMIKLEGIAYSSTGVWYFAPSLLAFFPADVSIGGGSWSLSYIKTTNEFSLMTGMDRRSAVAYATVYYTKTN